MQLYETIDRVRVSVDQFDSEERRVFQRLMRYAARKPDWNDFTNRSWEWLKECYDPRGLSAKQIIERPLYLVAEDLEARVAIAQGKARDADYRDDLQRLIGESGTTCYKLARQAHISESQLSHVLKGRKNLSLAKLTTLLDALGHRITFVPKAGAAAPIMRNGSPAGNRAAMNGTRLRGPAAKRRGRPKGAKV